MVLFSHETHSLAGPEAFGLLNEIAEYAAAIESVSKKLFMEDAMLDLCTTLCRGVARQVIASARLQARLDGGAVLPGLHHDVPTDGLYDVPKMQPCKCVPPLPPPSRAS